MLLLFDCFGTSRNLKVKFRSVGPFRTEKVSFSEWARPVIHILIFLQNDSVIWWFLGSMPQCGCNIFTFNKKETYTYFRAFQKDSVSLVIKLFPHMRYVNKLFLLHASGNSMNQNSSRMCGIHCLKSMLTCSLRFEWTCFVPYGAQYGAWCWPCSRFQDHTPRHRFAELCLIWRGSTCADWFWARTNC